MKHSQEEWKILIKDFRNSGLSQRKWCRLHDEDRNRLQYRNVLFLISFAKKRL